MRKLAAVLCLGFVGLAVPATSHEWYDYDCCDTRDCYPLTDEAELSELPNGNWEVRWVSPLSGKTISGIVPARAVRSSQNAQRHGCEIPRTETPRCIYIHRGV